MEKCKRRLREHLHNLPGQARLAQQGQHQCGQRLRRLRQQGVDRTHPKLVPLLELQQFALCVMRRYRCRAVLTYNPTSGHIKRDGVVVGNVKRIKTKFVFIRFKFDKIEASAATVEKLLPKIKELLS